MCLGCDDNGFAGNGEWHDDSLVGIERFVRDQDVALHCRQEMICADQIMCVTAGQKETDRDAKRTGQGYGFWCSGRRATACQDLRPRGTSRTLRDIAPHRAAFRNTDNVGIPDQ